MLAFSTLLAFAGNFAFAGGSRSMDQLLDNMTAWAQFILVAVVVTSVCWQFKRERPDE